MCEGGFTGCVMTRFQPFLLVFFPVATTLNISSSLIPRTLGRGTLKRAAFSARLFLIELLRALADAGFCSSVLVDIPFTQRSSHEPPRSLAPASPLRALWTFISSSPSPPGRKPNTGFQVSRQQRNSHCDPTNNLVQPPLTFPLLQP